MPRTIAPSTGDHGSAFGAGHRAVDPGDSRALARAQVFVEDLAHPSPEVEDAHHLARVLRLRRGEVVVAADGRGGWRMCEFRGQPSPSGVSDEQLLEPTGPVHVDPRPEPTLSVGFAPAKGDRPELVVQKLTELGMDRIVVLSARWSVVRWDSDRAGRALDRLRRIALEASAQCRRVWLPEVSGPIGVAELCLQPDGVAMAERGGPPPDARCRTVAVGPEGGWAPEERALGLPEVGLGPHVLRAETAAIAAAAALSMLRDATVSARRPVPDPIGGSGSKAVPGNARAGRSRR